MLATALANSLRCTDPFAVFALGLALLHPGHELLRDLVRQHRFRLRDKSRRCFVAEPHIGCTLCRESAFNTEG